MRIPLDYYRILGLPLAASEEQLRQAYSDRRQQLPRREYSQVAINSRKQLIEEAYVVLSDPKERRAYDQLYLAHAYGSERENNPTVAVENRAADSDSIESQGLSIEINPDELAGALLILQELGEYELVLKLGHPYLTNNNSTGVQAGKTLETSDFSDIDPQRADVVLTVALACLELGREEWQQGHYENAAASLETGDQLLAHFGLFPKVQAEIQADLYRLRPYRILELLALPLEKTAERKQGLQLLQDILGDRGGIDGTGNDHSGLNIDDFLRFIQQLRNHLTVAEQHQLFEAESKRPSAVAIYLAVYALIARGFSQRQPALIQQAKQMLIRLGKRQDVHLEQSLCALMLGQTEEATRALELSQEYEALAFIREHSQNSPDLLPGLCLYGEHWLQNDVFPNFRDLAKQQASLKDYFADRRVQTYLEQLPTQPETNYEGSITNQPSHSPTQINPKSYRSNPNVVYGQFPNIRTHSSSSSPTSPTHSPTEGTGLDMPVTPVSGVECVSRSNNYYMNGSARGGVPSQAQTPRRRKSSPSAYSRGHNREQQVAAATRRRRSASRGGNAKMRLLWVLGTTLASLLVLWLAISTTVKFVHNALRPAPTLQDPQLSIQINEPPLTIPGRNSKPQFPTGNLTEATAQEVIQTWLATKSAALGPNHEIDSLENILIGSALTQWRLIAQQDKADNRYRKYEHSLKIESLEIAPTDQEHAAVQASVTEATSFYENGLLNQQKSSKETVRVRYNLVRKPDGWRIREISVLNKES
ncbi:IMS domain-containing protein [Fischerella sp. NIES-3754]|uniref:IMS domain-containing protein n=1 Tax=Fischerella sp. NIES-3754 TaxID=1752063 RepID=UPI000722926F|nr:IMS domain-containing protein [Fischerella sp. NIES-3754]BAU07955.1 heat shock protein DnaJ domain-containing protein [Fischerella sp. NIES-3754]